MVVVVVVVVVAFSVHQIYTDLCVEYAPSYVCAVFYVCAL